jgi:integrase
MRGNITKRGKSSWQLKFDVGKSNGKRQTHYKTVHGSYKDAQKVLTSLLNAADTNALPALTRATVADYLRAWLDTTSGLSPKTVERYRELAERQIIPHLGSEKVQWLKAEQVEAWHAALLKSGLTARTVVHAHRVLARVLRRAKNSGASTVDLPAVEDREMQILEADQIADVLNKLKEHALCPVVSLALATGMRRGELLGLQWGDVDLDGGALRVERSIEETKTGLRVKPPKTKRGRRNIALPPETVAMLRAHKVKTMELRLTLGMGSITSETWVFSTIEGALLSPDNLSRDWRRVCLAKKLPLVRFHDLRHTHASILIGKGVDILTISRRLGHYKPSVTLDTYGHLIKGADLAAADAIAGVLK